MSRLVDWFVQHGGFVHPSVRFSQDSAGGVAAFANEDLSDLPNGGLHLLTCPLRLQLSYRQAPEAVQGQLSENILSNIALIKELLLGEESLWAPYITCLPTSEQLNTPIYFAEEMTEEAINERRNDTAWLLGTNLDKVWRPRKEQWEEEWQNAVRVLEKNGVATEGYTWDAYAWAATIFTSRSFISDPGLSKDNASYAVLLPVIDLLNHRFPAKVAWFFDKGNFQFRTEEPVSRGQEIFNNYGGKGNEERRLLVIINILDETDPVSTEWLRFLYPRQPLRRGSNPVRTTSSARHGRTRKDLGRMEPNSVPLHQRPRSLRWSIPDLAVRLSRGGGLGCPADDMDRNGSSQEVPRLSARAACAMAKHAVCPVRFAGDLGD